MLVRSASTSHASNFQDMWKSKSARPATSWNAGYAPEVHTNPDISETAYLSHRSAFCPHETSESAHRNPILLKPLCRKVYNGPVHSNPGNKICCIKNVRINAVGALLIVSNGIAVRPRYGHFWSCISFLPGSVWADSLVSCGQKANSCNKIIMAFQKLIRIGVDSVWTGLQILQLAHCKRIQDSWFWIPYRGFRIPGTGFQCLSVELGFWIQIVSGIPDSLSCIPDSKAHDSRFHE